MIYGRSYHYTDSLVTIPYKHNSLRIEYNVNSNDASQSALFWADLMNPFLRRVESRIHEQFGRVVTLRLQEPEQKAEDVEEVFRQTEAIRSKAYTAAVQHRPKVTAKAAPAKRIFLFCKEL